MFFPNCQRCIYRGLFLLILILQMFTYLKDVSVVFPDILNLSLFKKNAEIILLLCSVCKPLSLWPSPESDELIFLDFPLWRGSEGTVTKWESRLKVTIMGLNGLVWPWAFVSCLRLCTHPRQAPKSSTLVLYPLPSYVCCTRPYLWGSVAHSIVLSK